MERYIVWKNQVRDAAIYQDFVTSEEYEVMNKLGTILPSQIDRDEFYGTYSSYIESPLYNGKLQFDME